MKKIVLTVLICLLGSNVYAHSGRIDGNGGHRVNKSFKYDGKFIVIHESSKYYEQGIFEFKKGDYHFHVQPRVNGYLNGIYIPSNNVHETRTDIIIKSENNVVASKKSNIYHKSNSGYVNRMKLENIVIFTDCYEAEDNGYKPSRQYGECK